MITPAGLKEIARARLAEARVLVRNRRYDGAVYLCGYAVEIGLKARICRTLKWTGFPTTAREFRDYKSFQTHDLEVLLHLSGIEDRIKSRFLLEWNTVIVWNPEMRYKTIGSMTAQDAQTMAEAAGILLRAL
jgi:hypothetical protein